jgi:ribosomal protein S18 acetylase RimI-like enzyme
MENKGNLMHRPGTVPACLATYDRSIATLVAAFIADPFIRWMFPDPKQYSDYFPLVLKHFAGGAFEHSSAYRSDDFMATALWLPPGVSPDEEAVGAVMQEGVAAKLQKEVFEALEQIGGGHPEEAHWYLPVIGVDPRSQGRGYGSMLLARGLEICDRDHVAAYLEATNAASIPLYQRFGFKVFGQIQVGSSPAITPMFRPAR